MCGRYYVDDDTAKEIEKVIRQVNQKLRAQKAAHDTMSDGYSDMSAIQSGDIYPTAFAPVIEAGYGAGGKAAECRCRMLRWGIPGYTPKGGRRKGQILFNARSETAMEKPTFREAVRSRRVVIPAAGFYEWNPKKEKYQFWRPDSKALFMAGCMNRYEDGDRFVILTTAANESMEPVHERMPLILEPDEVGSWIWDDERTKSLLEKESCLLERRTDYEQMTLF